ncbi:hypothetical protein [Cupriavidus sp. amp6]|nr:hypothetical protein [Cupriavidus sp. amp6]
MQTNDIVIEHNDLTLRQISAFLPGASTRPRAKEGMDYRAVQLNWMQ